MQMAIDLAKMPFRQTLPNPQVGAIVVNNDVIVGMGSHLLAGNPHAEVYALEQARELSVGATLYVTLEPCTHFGKTPPCVERVISSGIKKVYIANLDPNPLVAGTSIQKLKEANIEVIVGLCASEAYEINRVFFHNIKIQQPFITLKAGMSLDARLATKNNISQWITSTDSRYDAHIERTKHDAILVGIGTVLADNPSLIPHLLEHNNVFPTRIILDSHLQTPLNSKILNTLQAQTWIVTLNKNNDKHQAYLQQGVKLLVVPDMHLATILNVLYKNNIFSLMVEGGEKILSSFMDENLFNQVICYVSPQLIGSKQAKSFYLGYGYSELDSNPKMIFKKVELLGADIKITAFNLKDSLCLQV